MRKLKVRKLTSKDWKLYKTIRLRSLEESPTSFSSTYESEKEFSKGRWIERISATNKAHQSHPIVAEVSGKAVGVAAGVIHTELDDRAKIYQMWVEPEFRNRGIGKLLLGNIVAWAKELGVSAIELDVTTSNVAAVNLYKVTGFSPLGEARLLHPEAELRVQTMVFKIDEDVA
jgi:ribosomal protein S18 acetylase RimI-like enzyme